MTTCFALLLSPSAPFSLFICTLSLLALPPPSSLTPLHPFLSAGLNDQSNVKLENKHLHSRLPFSSSLFPPLVPLLSFFPSKGCSPHKKKERLRVGETGFHLRTSRDSPKDSEFQASSSLISAPQACRFSTTGMRHRPAYLMRVTSARACRGGYTGAARQRTVACRSQRRGSSP